MAVADDIAEQFLGKEEHTSPGMETAEERPGAMLRKAIKAGDDSAIEAAIHACMEKQY